MTQPRAATRLTVVLSLVLALCAGLLIANRPVPALAADDCVPTGTDVTARAYNDDGVTLNGLPDGATAEWGGSTMLRIDFSGLKNLKAGDFFTYTLPPGSGLSPRMGETSFVITDPSDNGKEIGCAFFATRTNTLTVVFNQAAADKSTGGGVNGWVEVRAQIFPEGATEPKKYPIRLTMTKTIWLELKEGSGPGDGFHKDGWLRVDLGNPAFDPARAIIWRIAFPRQTFDMTDVKVVDDSTDPKWWFNCALVQTTQVQVLNRLRPWKNRDLPMSPDEQAIADTVKVTCEKENVTATVPKIPAGYMVILPSMFASVPSPMPSGAYTNTAVLTTNEIKEAQTAGQQIDLSGSGQGTGDTTPAQTPPQETSPAQTPPQETSPAQTPPQETTPAETTPAQTTPAETPSATTPSQVPSQPAPVHPRPGLPHTGR